MKRKETIQQIDRRATMRKAKKMKYNEGERQREINQI